MSAGLGDWLSAALAGPGHLRFVIQPLVAILLGLRDGRLDAEAGRPPYLWGLLFHRGRAPRVWSALRAAAVPLAVAVVLDALLQFYASRSVRPEWALAMGTLLIALPYMAARGLGNRITAAVRRRRAG